MFLPFESMQTQMGSCPSSIDNSSLYNYSMGKRKSRQNCQYKYLLNTMYSNKTNHFSLNLSILPSNPQNHPLQNYWHFKDVSQFFLKIIIVMHWLTIRLIVAILNKLCQLSHYSNIQIITRFFFFFGWMSCISYAL